jgi:hypothetical protein
MGETFTCALIWCGRIQTTNLIINLDHDDWIFSDENKTLAESGFGVYSLCSVRPTRGLITHRTFTENETEVSFFNRDMYEAFKLDPQVFFPLIFATCHVVISLLPRKDTVGELMFSASSLIGDI